MDSKEKIELLRKKAGWSKRHLAHEAGLTPSTFYNWYNERNNEPSKKAIEDICATFDVSLSEFYSDVETDKFTVNEIKLLEAFKNVPETKQEVVISVAKVLQKE